MMSRNKKRNQRIRKLKQQREGKRVLLISVVVTVLIMIILYFGFSG